jgi:hypothetical protein
VAAARASPYAAYPSCISMRAVCGWPAACIGCTWPARRT